MKVALLGYGKMGKEIEKIAIARGHEIVIKKDAGDVVDITLADVAIDFSIPTAAFENITDCFRNQVPVVSGTTGWLEKLDEAKQICSQNNAAFIYASNFSLGVNIYFELNKKLAKLMKPVQNYEVAIEEIHHTQKLDAPSGTAITLAEGIIENSDKKSWLLDMKLDDAIPIFAKRIPDVPGTHTISYQSTVDEIEIKHTAYNRQGFALGAVVAAEWLADKKGIFTMKDVLQIKD